MQNVAGRVMRARVALAILTVLVASPVFAQNPMLFGVDAKSVTRARTLGLSVHYGTSWAGAWNQKWGWGDVERELLQAASAGVTPVVHWWYWGDDISPACVESRCADRYHGVMKDKATWTRLSRELAALILRTQGAGARAIVVIEPEFNKNGIESYEPFDGYFVEQAAIFRQAGVTVLLGFGGWGMDHWGTFDRAVAAADILGTSALRSSLRDAPWYGLVVDDLVANVRYLQARFNKPTFVTDLAVSSYPAPEYETRQAEVVTRLFARIEELKSTGVVGIVFRMLADDPEFDTTNYHGLAERHWGFLRADGSTKPAFAALHAGIAAAQPVPDALPAMYWRNEATGHLAVWFMQGRTQTASAAMSPTHVADTNWRIEAVMDIDADKDGDLIWRNGTTGDLAVWIMNGRTLVDSQSLVPGRVADLTWRIVGSGDFNGDRNPDLLWRNDTTGQLALWYMNGRTLIDSVYTSHFVADTNWRTVAVNDMDGDGDADLVLRHSGNGEMAIWFMNGRTLADSQYLSVRFVSDLNWKVVGSGDFNGDGRPDLLWQNDATGDLAAWHMNGRTLIDSVALNPGRVTDLNWKIIGPR